MRFFGLFLVSVLTAIVFAFDARAEFTTGTDDDGNFYFSQIMSEWCSLNFDSNPSVADMKDCFNKIGAAYHAHNETEAAEARRKFQKMKMDTNIQAFIAVQEILNKFANDKTEEKAENISLEGDDNFRTIVSANGEISNKNLHMGEEINALKEIMMETRSLMNFENNSEKFAKDEGSK